MDNSFLVNSIGIGGALFVGLMLFWFISKYLKKRFTAEQSARIHAASSKISWEEKRSHPRMAVSWQAAIGTSDPTDTVQLKDISLGGAFVVCTEPLALNEKFKIRIQIPNRNPLSLNAEVVWSNVNVPADRVVNRGMGIRFIENTEEDREGLREALAASLGNSQGP